MQNFNLEVKCNPYMLSCGQKKILFSNSIYHSTFCEDKHAAPHHQRLKKLICMCLILLTSLRLPAARVDRTLSTDVYGVFLITCDSGAVFSSQSAVSSNQIRNIKDFILGNKYMHSLEGKKASLIADEHSSEGIC